MNGTYRIPIPANWDKPAEEIPAVSRLIKSLDPGAVVDIAVCDAEYDSARGSHFVEIIAVGGQAKAYRPSKPVRLPPVLTSEQIGKARVKAQAQLLQSRHAVINHIKAQLECRMPYGWRNGRYGYAYDRTMQERRKRVGKVIAEFCSRLNAGRRTVPPAWYYTKPSRALYTWLEGRLGFPVPRLSKLGKYDRDLGYVGFLVSRYADGSVTRTRDRYATSATPDEPEQSPIQTVILNKLDVEYWTAMLELAQARTERKTA